VLRRVNIITKRRTAAFAGNRISFQLLNDAAICAEKHGVDKMNYLLGHTRAVAARSRRLTSWVSTHKAIVDNVVAHIKDERIDTYKMPAYMKMLDQGVLGRKARQGGYFNRDAERSKPHSISPIGLCTDQRRSTGSKRLSRDQDGMYPRAIEMIKMRRVKRQNRATILGCPQLRVSAVTPEADGMHGTSTA
jgi:3-hydroxyacyl-CoA dehydrogenase